VLYMCLSVCCAAFLLDTNIGSSRLGRGAVAVSGNGCFHSLFKSGLWLLCEASRNSVFWCDARGKRSTICGILWDAANMIVTIEKTCVRLSNFFFGS